MSIKGFLILATLLFCGCENLKVQGNMQYVHAEQSDYLHSVTVTYTNKLNKIPFVIRGRANHDPINKDRPIYQETSIEYWFW